MIIEIISCLGLCTEYNTLKNDFWFVLTLILNFIILMFRKNASNHCFLVSGVCHARMVFLCKKCNWINCFLGQWVVSISYSLFLSYIGFTYSTIWDQESCFIYLCVLNIWYSALMFLDVFWSCYYWVYFQKSEFCCWIALCFNWANTCLTAYWWL